MAGSAKHLILYDGVCNLCDGMIGFVLARDRAGLFRVEPLQSAMGQGVLEDFSYEPTQLDTLVVIADFESPEPAALTRSAAAMFVLDGLGWPWRVACLLRVAPPRWLDRAYDMVARNRYRIFGRRASCPLPDDPKHRP